MTFPHPGFILQVNNLKRKVSEDHMQSVPWFEKPIANIQFKQLIKVKYFILTVYYVSERESQKNIWMTKKKGG